jgi:hypothetical protein
MVLYIYRTSSISNSRKECFDKSIQCVGSYPLANTHSLHWYSPFFDISQKQPLQFVCLKACSFSPNDHLLSRSPQHSPSSCSAFSSCIFRGSAALGCTVFQYNKPYDSTSGYSKYISGEFRRLNSLNSVVYGLHFSSIEPHTSSLGGPFRLHILVIILILLDLYLILSDTSKHPAQSLRSPLF